MYEYVTYRPVFDRPDRVLKTIMMVEGQKREQRDV